MKKINFGLGILLIISLLINCSNSNKNESDNQETRDSVSVKVSDNESNVKVEKASLVYFHYTKRCATCNAIGVVSREVVADYGAKATYTEYNLDEAEGDEMGKKMRADGQTLLLVYGDKVINLTEDAFMNAKSDPDMFKRILREKLDAVLL